MRTEKIMIVEDESIVAFNIQEKLLKLGYDVPVICSSSKEALEGLAQFDPDLVLMDVHIQGNIDGIKTAEQISQQSQVPVVYLTAHAEERIIERARATKPYGYLLKPFSERELHATIQMALERYRVGLDLQASEERVRLALSAACMGSWEFDPDSNTLLCDEMANKIFRVSTPSSHVGLDRILNKIHCDDSALVTEALSRCFKEFKPCHIEFRSANDDHAECWLNLQANTFATRRAHAVDRIVGVVQDISDKSWPTFSCAAQPLFLSTHKTASPFLITVFK